jgi:hypothetical protein
VTAPVWASSNTRARYGKVPVAVPNGRTVGGYLPGLCRGKLPEHALRDKLATQIKGVTEASLGYGRVDVLTAQTVFEVEHHTKWRTAIRQALQYGAQTGCAPAVALFGDCMSADALERIYIKLRDGTPPVQLWFFLPRDERWEEISSRTNARKVGSAARAGDNAVIRAQRRAEREAVDWQSLAEADRLKRQLARAFSKLNDAVTAGGQLEFPLGVGADVNGGPEADRPAATLFTEAPNRPTDHAQTGRRCE